MTVVGDAEPSVRAAIDDHGPISFAELMELALYEPEQGFYATVGRAGRRGDFLTSPEVGPLFGAVVARALDARWRAAGEPSALTVVETGAGPGTLARAVLAAQPECGQALHYVLVERSAAQRALHQPLLERPAPPVESRAELPPIGDGLTVVLANELLDNLPVDLFERTSDGWAEVRVGADGDHLAEVLAPAAPDDAALLDGLAPAAARGARVPRAGAAAAWVDMARRLGDHVIALDYATTTEALAGRPQDEWLRTYRQHDRGGPPLEHLGSQDITCEVPVDQLPPPASDRSQAEWLAEHGIEELVAEGRRTWAERGHVGDLAAVRARSRVTEAAALLDPTGLGAFRVLEW
jgi:SAM-dependent MidA family methyltransferase